MDNAGRRGLENEHPQQLRGRQLLVRIVHYAHLVTPQRANGAVEPYVKNELRAAQPESITAVLRNNICES